MQDFQSKFRIIVKTGASKTDLLEFDKDRNAYRMNVKAQPEKGRANAEIIKYFSRKLKKKVEIVSGFKSREKLIRVE